MSELVEKARSRAEAALNVRRYAEALREAAVVAAADPGSASGQALLARAHLGLGQLAEAQEAAEAGIARNPDSDWMHRLRAIALARRGRHAESLSSADEALRLEPGLAYNHSTRGHALKGLGRTVEARDAFARALELAPDDADLHRLLGDTFLAKGPHAAAEKHYRAALAIAPNDGATLNNLGVALNLQKRPQEAAVAFKAAILADPGLRTAKRNAHETLGSLLRFGAIGASLVVGSLQALRLLLNAAGDPGLQAAVVAVFALTVGGVGVFRSHQRRRRRAALEALDPQLLTIFRKLQADKKAGRL